ncbi:MAG: scpB [Clostridia bacterium]|jgi:segregation and condensation protein B|nr:scpB [Clostridia bacterium]
MENIENIIEAVLFALGRSITLDELSQTLKVDLNEINSGVENLKKKYNESNAIVLYLIEDSVQLVTNKKYYEYVNLFIENTKRQNLSSSAMETLTIIAYNSKITKAEIERIRGVSSDFAVGRLLECGLIEEVARLNAPGRPAIYSVTREFLKNCNIKNISELPNYEDIKIKDEQMMINDIEN